MRSKDIRKNVIDWNTQKANNPKTPQRDRERYLENVEKLRAE